VSAQFSYPLHIFIHSAFLAKAVSAQLNSITQILITLENAKY